MFRCSPNPVFLEIWMAGHLVTFASFFIQSQPPAFAMGDISEFG
jgi:hypothetical protein